MGVEIRPIGGDEWEDHLRALAEASVERPQRFGKGWDTIDPDDPNLPPDLRLLWELTADPEPVPPAPPPLAAPERKRRWWRR